MKNDVYRDFGKAAAEFQVRRIEQMADEIVSNVYDEAALMRLLDYFKLFLSENQKKYNNFNSSSDLRTENLHLRENLDLFFIKQLVCLQVVRVCDVFKDKPIVIEFKNIAKKFGETLFDEELKDFSIIDILKKAKLPVFLANVIPKEKQSNLEEQLNDIDDPKIITLTIADVLFSGDDPDDDLIDVILRSSGKERQKFLVRFLLAVTYLKLAPDAWASKVEAIKFDEPDAADIISRVINEAIQKSGAREMSEI